MRKKKRGVQDINAGSMADIAFLLLVFFLVTTSMASEQGILNLLPPELTGEPPKFKEHNVLKILVNKDDYLLVENEYMNIDDLAEFTVKFITNNGQNPELSDSPDMAVVSLKNDRGTSYNTYISVQNELRSAYNQVRNDVSQEKFGLRFNDLSDAQQKQIKELIPQKISEAEPANVGGNI